MIGGNSLLGDDEAEWKVPCAAHYLAAAHELWAKGSHAEGCTSEQIRVSKC